MLALSRNSCKILDSLFEAIGTFLIVLGGVVIVLTVVIQVLLRYVLKAPLFGLEEFSLTVAIWVYFLGAVFGTKYDSHVQGDVAASFFKTPRAQAWVRVVVWCLSFVACAAFLYHASKYSWWVYRSGERTTGLWWPRITSVGSMFFGGVLMTLYSLTNIARYLGQAREAHGELLGEASHG